MMIQGVDWLSRQILLNITQEQLENCPLPWEDEPVSRKHEIDLLSYYGHSYYWSGDHLWGMGNYPELGVDVSTIEASTELGDPEKDTYLRSFTELKGYTIKPANGDIGHVEDFIMDDKTWAIRYVVVDIRNWLPGGHKVLLSMDWIESVSWAEASLTVSLSVDQVKDSPQFDPEKPVNIEYETRLYDYYGWPYEKTVTRKLQELIGNPFL